MLSHTRYGGNRKTLLKMHKTMILPILDYGSFLYHSANSNVLQTLNVINHSGIRLCTGAFRTSPFISLIVDSGLSTLNFKREKQSLKFFQKVLSFTSHPLYSFAHNENSYKKFENKSKCYQSFYIRAKNLLHYYNIPYNFLLNSNTNSFKIRFNPYKI